MEAFEKVYAELDRADYMESDVICRVRWLVQELERELSERYMELPLDADGKPIHVGDEMLDNGSRITVTSLTRDGFYGGWNVPMRGSAYRHAEPDTWESIIRDVRAAEGCGSVGEFMVRHGAEFVERCEKLAGDAR